MADIIRELDDYGASQGGSACLVNVHGDYFIVSSIPSAPDHGGPETLAFACDAEGEVMSWSDVAGGRGWTRQDTIDELELIGPDPESNGRGMWGDTKPIDERTTEEVIEGFVSSLSVVSKNLRNR